MDYKGFGHVVESCPVNPWGQREAASRLGCGVDKFRNSQYLCVPNFRKTAIVEYCYKGTVGLHKQGSCLVVNDEAVVDIVSCRSFTEGCTKTFFKSSDLYQYPACHQINMEYKCFSADPECPVIDPKMTTSNATSVTVNSTINNFATTLGYSNVTYYSDDSQIPAGTIALFLIFVAVAVLFLIFLLVGYRLGHFNSRKRKRKGTSKHKSFSKDEENCLIILEGAVYQEEEEHNMQDEGKSQINSEDAEDWTKEEINIQDEENSIIKFELAAHVTNVECKIQDEEERLNKTDVAENLAKDGNKNRDEENSLIKLELATHVTNVECKIQDEEKSITPFEVAADLTKEGNKNQGCRAPSINKAFYTRSRYTKLKGIHKEKNQINSEVAEDLTKEEITCNIQDKEKSRTISEIAEDLTKKETDIQDKEKNQINSEIAENLTKEEITCNIQGKEKSQTISEIAEDLTKKETDIQDKEKNQINSEVAEDLTKEEITFNIQDKGKSHTNSEIAEDLTQEETEGDSSESDINDETSDDNSEGDWIESGMNDETFDYNCEDHAWGPGHYSRWQTSLSDQFSKLSDDQLFVLYCFMCSDSGPPDFTDTEWLDMFNKIRYRFSRSVNNNCKEVQQILIGLKSNSSFWTDQDEVTKSTKDEIIYKITSIDYDTPFCETSYKTANVYLRSDGYDRKTGEKCVVCVKSICNDLLIRRLQMNILTHVTMEDRNIHKKVSQILNVPVAESHQDRCAFLIESEKQGEIVPYRGRNQGSVNQVKWLWRYENAARPDIVRSTIGLHPHWDIYIIDNQAYRKGSDFHNCTSDVRCLLYCLLLVDKYTMDVNDSSYRTTLNKIREKYFKNEVTSNDIKAINLPEDFINREDNNRISFKSENVRHDVMYAFVTECLVEESDLVFFLNTASGHVISEYCRPWDHKRTEEERCIYIPDFPKLIQNLFIEKLPIDIIAFSLISDWKICDEVIRRLGIPREILQWDQEARQRYVEYAKRGTQIVHHARGMIVGCAGAGKTTLLKRLLRCSEEEIMNVKSTEGLEVHQEVFQIDEDTETLKAIRQCTADEAPEMSEIIHYDRKTLSFFDFGGQCVYYACHQIYLTRRAFYVVVVDASKRLDEIVDKNVCNQDGSVFSRWTYGDYFVFWIKSIKTYCITGNDSPDILIVGTHWENKKYENEEEFIKSLQESFPKNSDLSQYVSRENCFSSKFPLTRLVKLEQRIFEIVSQPRWTENIPKEWAFFGIEISQKKSSQKIMRRESYSLQGKEKDDMLRFLHDSGKVLFFNEIGYNASIILDVQWFVDAFKKVIIDKLDFEGIAASREDWDEYYKTGILKKSLLTNIWKHADKLSFQKLNKKSSIEEVRMEETNFYGDPRCMVYHSETLLRMMQRLGLMAVDFSSESIYIPCMNRREIEESQRIIAMSKGKSSILIFQFDFLPYFLFFRLVVVCMQNWKALKSLGTFCLYKNIAFFSSDSQHFAIAVTASSIQLQVFQPIEGETVDIRETCSIQEKVELELNELIGTYQKKMMFKRGISCKKQIDQFLTMDIDGHFLQEKDLPTRNSVREVCPLHQGTDRHYINIYKLTQFWNLGQTASSQTTDQMNNPYPFWS